MAKPAEPVLRRDALRLIGVWCALVLYVGACSPLGFGAVALAGVLDRSHRIGVDGGTEGLKLVLKHGRNCAPHHHGIVAQALTLLARPASTTNPDHVIQFTTTDVSSQQLQLTRPRVADSEQAVFSLAEMFSCSPSAPASFVSTHPPPRVCGQLLCLRSTLLLI